MEGTRVSGQKKTVPLCERPTSPKENNMNKYNYRYLLHLPESMMEQARDIARLQNFTTAKFIRQSIFRNISHFNEIERPILARQREFVFREQLPDAFFTPQSR
jgi:hypothetical protein